MTDAWRQALTPDQIAEIVAEAASQLHVSATYMDLAALDIDGVESSRVYISLASDDNVLLSSAVEAVQQALADWCLSQNWQVL